MNLIQVISDWWRRPRARQRILNAMSETEWRAGLTIIEAAKVSIGEFYSRADRMEEQGLVESKWEPGPVYDPRRPRGYRQRLYRRITL